MKKILVTGCKGYIGTVLCSTLRECGYEVVGIDVGYYEDCLLEDIDELYHFHAMDIRDITIDVFLNIDCVVHLAALSNDPLGEFSPKLTEEINGVSTINLARYAVKAGVGQFIYVSSQSMYGVSAPGVEISEDESEKNPITAYAKTKWETELYLKGMDKGATCFTYLRPSTVFGYSPRLRSDIVFNNFIGAALTKGKIEIFSDGSPWRPVIHVNDVCNVIISCLTQDQKLISNRSYNLGIKNGNFTVLDLAKAAKQLVPHADLKILGKSTDPRSYMVSFDRLHNEFSKLSCSTNLLIGGEDLVKNLQRIKFTELDFLGPKTVRLEKLKQLSKNGTIDSNLRMVKNEV